MPTSPELDQLNVQIDALTRFLEASFAEHNGPSVYQATIDKLTEDAGRLVCHLESGYLNHQIEDLIDRQQAFVGAEHGVPPYQSAIDALIFRVATLTEQNGSGL